MSGKYENIVIPKTPEDVVDGKCKEFMETIKNDPQYWSNFKLLNHIPPDELGNMQLVRYRGVLLDMVDDGFFMKRVMLRNEDGTTRYKNCMYRENCNVEEDVVVQNNVDFKEMGQRRSFYVVSTPGLNSWAAECEQKHNAFVKFSNPPANVDEKMDEDEPIKNADINESNGMLEEAQPRMPAESNFYNSPIPDRPGTGCFVRVYENGDDFHLNCLVDAIGFVWVDLPARDTTSDSKGFYYDERRNHEGRIIPRMHALAIHQLPFYNPLLDVRLTAGSQNSDHGPINMASVHGDLVTLMKLCLFNDELAAQYMVLHLISTVYTRPDDMAIGKFSINLCDIPPPFVDTFAKQLYRILELIIPASHYFPLTLKNLSKTRLSPIKESDDDVLRSGMLQLGQHTHLMLDETALDEGTLLKDGLMNLAALQLLTTTQTIRARFVVYDITYPCDVPVLLVSTKDSVLKITCDVTMPLAPEYEQIELVEEAFKAARHFLSPQRLDRIRRYLTMAKTAEITTDDNVENMISADYVQMRQENAIRGSNDLHSLLSIARMTAIAHGKQHVDQEAWMKAKVLLDRQIERASKRPKNTKII